MPQEGRAGQCWLLFSSGTLLVCGIACLAACLSASELVPNSLETGCEALGSVLQCASPACTDACKQQFLYDPSGLQKCFDACAEATDPRQGTEQCLVFALESLGCVCPPTNRTDDCDCTGSQYDQVDTLWRTMCLALGALGILGAVIFTGIPAGVAGFKRIKCINVTCFSVCSGIWSLIFIGCGAGFLALSVMLTPTGPWGSEIMTVCPEENVKMGDDLESKTAADFVNCAHESVCRGVTAVLNNLVGTSAAIGAPYFIAGIVMFVGCYVCCCCKKSVPQDDGEEIAKVAPIETPQAPILQAVPVAQPVGVPAGP